MRILFITNYYPPHEIGGYEQLCRDVAEALRARGHVCEVITSTRGVGCELTQPDGIHRVLRISPDYGSALPVALQFLLKRRAAEAHNQKVFEDVSRAYRPDVVFIWNLSDLPRNLTTAAESLPRVTTAYWLAGDSPADPDEYWRYWQTPGRTSTRRRRIKSLVAPFALRKMRAEGKPTRPEMRHVATVSRYTRERGLAEGTLLPHTQVIYNGVEADQYCTERMEPGIPFRMLYAGRMSEDKGPQTAISAIANLRDSMGIVDVRLSLVGSGPSEYMAYLHEMVDRLSLGDIVRFYGWTPREEMPAIMAAHDALLLCTINDEPFARVVLEAMASGLVVVGTLTGGTAEILDEGITGLVFPAGDSEALSRQVARLIRCSGLWHSLSSAAQGTIIERFTMDYMVDRLELFLDQAVAEDRITWDR